MVVKVCFLCANHAPEAWGGTEQVQVALARELRASGVEVVAIAGSDVPHAGVDVRQEQHDGVTVHRVFKLPDEWDRQGFVRPRILDLVRGLLQRERPDVLHVHSTASLGAGVTQLAQELGIPVLMAFHDLWVTCARYFRIPHGGVTCPTGSDRTPCVTCVNDALQTDPADVAARLAERDRVLRHEVQLTAARTAPSATAARLVRDCLPHAGPIEVIPHGLLRPVAAGARALPREPGEVLRVGTFGGLVAEKGVHQLIDAVRGLPCELHLAGRLYDKALLDHLQRSEAGGLRWHWHGEYTPADPHPATRLHLAVFPSLCQETYGLVVDEALAHGLPTVLSDRGAFAERATAPGVVVTPLDRLADVLHELVTCPARLQALRAAIPASLPTIATAAARHLELYRRLCRS